MANPRRTWLVAGFGSLALFAAVGTPVFHAHGHQIATSFVLSAGWWSVVQMLAWGVADVCFPERMTAWRARYMAGAGKVEQSVGRRFSRMFDLDPDAPDRPGSRTLRRVRSVGLMNLLMAAILVLLLITWVPGWFDSVFS